MRAYVRAYVSQTAVKCSKLVERFCECDMEHKVAGQGEVGQDKAE